MTIHLSLKLTTWFFIHSIPHTIKTFSGVVGDVTKFIKYKRKNRLASNLGMGVIRYLF